MTRSAWVLALALFAVQASARQPVRYCDYPVYPPDRKSVV